MRTFATVAGDQKLPVKAWLPLSPGLLNIERKTRSNRLPWTGQFSPQLVEALLTAYAPKGAHLFDPFLGSGTVLLEAGRLGLAAAGSEINPAAVLLAKTFELIPLSPPQRHALVRQMEQQVLPLATAADDSVQRQHRLLEHHAPLPPGPLKIASDAYIVLLDFARPTTPERMHRIWCRLKKTILELPVSSQPVRALLSDARAVPLPEQSVDLVLTSPPYLNVFNYHQQYRKSVEALGWNPLRVAPSEIGANRKHRGNRFLTVIQYCLDMFQVLQKLRQLCRPTAELIFVLGRESAVRKTTFRNGELFRALALAGIGFDHVLNQERVFTNRFGKRIVEEIIHLVPRAEPAPNGLERARDVAACALQEALQRAPVESREDLLAALGAVPTVSPSPVLLPAEAR